MLLKDSTDRASVDLFLRNLEFDFPTRDVVGIPGNLIGLKSPHPEDDAVILLHELEHIYSLSRPLGPFFSAIGLRAFDLRNELATRVIELRKKRAAFATLQDIPHEFELDGAHLALDALSLAEFARRVIVTAELMLPLLEGMAMISEMELDEASSSWAWMTITTIEFLHYAHRMRLVRPDLREAFADEEERRIFLEGLFDALEKQLAYSRKERLAGDLINLMFFEEETEGGSRPQYFYGYLYLRRLYQEWHERMPELDFEAFFLIVNKFICSVIPLTILPMFSLANHPWASGELPALFESMLHGALSLPREQIEFLRDTSDLTFWNFSDKRIKSLAHQEPIAGTGAQGAFEARVFTEIVWSVFDRRDSKDALLDTSQILGDIERAKLLLRTGSREVIIFAVDEEERVALIGQPSRVIQGEKSGQLASDGATFFEFQDENVFKDFLQKFDPTNKLRRWKLGQTPYVFTGLKHSVKARLITFCHLWPYGGPDKATGQMPGSPAEIVRVLIPDGGAGRAFLSGPAISDLAAVVKTRDLINRQLLEGIKRALNVNYQESHEFCAVIASMYAEGSTPRFTALEMINRFPSDEFPALQSSCRSVFSTLLFPASRKADEPLISKQKLDVLIDELLEDDKVNMRRWMHGGLVLQSARAAPITDAQKQEALESLKRIRIASEAVFGIPLLKSNQAGSEIELDLVPGGQN